MKRGRLNGSQRWYCKSCKRTFVGHKRLTNAMVNILKVILLSKIFQKNTEYQPGLFIGSLPNLIKKNCPAFSFVR
ncbi:IS1/IS1595 family N-terminal zinc-binding domain-containing protein [Segatella buccae]|uniref:IS1/IS1595 family N-terminal zinc-binding domain-containing protein n=1 Tax=Segatella buccae TaxID=28126 RepID=UPI00402BAF78